MLDYIIVDERLRKGLDDVRVRRGVGAGMSYHMMVEGKINLGSQRRVKDSPRVMGKKVKVEKLREASVRGEYCRKVEVGLREYEGSLGENVEAMWRVVKESMVEFAKEVCGVREVSGFGRKATGWWNEEVKRAVREKKEAWLSLRRARG